MKMDEYKKDFIKVGIHVHNIKNVSTIICREEIKVYFNDNVPLICKPGQSNYNFFNQFCNGTYSTDYKDMTTFTDH